MLIGFTVLVDILGLLAMIGLIASSLIEGDDYGVPAVIVFGVCFLNLLSLHKHIFSKEASKDDSWFVLYLRRKRAEERRKLEEIEGNTKDGE